MQRQQGGGRPHAGDPAHDALLPSEAARHRIAVTGPLVPLDPTFYEQPVLLLARNLVGKVLVHASPDGTTAGRIVETEAYRGPDDLAAHSARGRRTKRTEAMFGPP